MKIDERIITAGMLFLLVFYITYRCSSSDPDKKITVLRDHGVSIENYYCPLKLKSHRVIRPQCP